jgi:predicted RNA binding protein YcfA (HicA-like mRNA interferase family)
MPKKIRELKTILRQAGWIQIEGGKGSHTKWMHPRVKRRIIVSGKDGDDAKPYQQRDVNLGVNETRS